MFAKRNATMFLSTAVIAMVAGAVQAQNAPLRINAGTAQRLQDVRALQFSNKALANSVKINTGRVSHERSFGGTRLRTTLVLNPDSPLARTRRGGGNGELQSSGSSRQEPSGDGLVCTSTYTRLSLNNDSFKVAATSAQASKLYPGAVYDFKNFFDGRMNPATGARHPVRIVASNVPGMANRGTGTYEVVEQPMQSSISNGVNRLTGRMPAGSRQMQSYAADVYQLSNAAETQLKLGASAASYGVSAEAVYGSRQRDGEQEFLVDVTQEMYTLSVEPDARGIFVDPAVATQGDKIMLGTVTYGQRMLLSVKTRYKDGLSAVNAQARFSSPFAKASASLESLQKSFSEETSVRVYAVGGNSPGFGPPQRIDDIKAWLDDYFRNTHLGNPQPIRYQFVNMNNEIVRAESATDNFVTRNCVPEEVTLTLTLESIKNLSGNDYTRDEVVKFGTRQLVAAHVGAQRYWPANGDYQHSICWWGDEGNVGNGCKPVREFNGSINVGESRVFRLKARDIGDGDFVNIHTDYIAMYRTRAGGSTNSRRDVDNTRIWLKREVMAADSKGFLKQVDIPFNGRTFRYIYRATLQ